MMNIMSVNSISIKTYNSWAVKPYYDKTRLKEGYIWLNGYKIRVGNTLKETVKNINKLFAKTGVRASVVKNSKGEERLVLKVLGRVLNINDPKGLLAELYKKEKIGKNKDNTIQVIRRLAGTGDVKINYNTKPFVKERYRPEYLKLSERNITQLAGCGVRKRENIELDSVELPTPIFEKVEYQDEYITESIKRYKLFDDDFINDYLSHQVPQKISSQNSSSFISSEDSSPVKNIPPLDINLIINEGTIQKRDSKNNKTQFSTYKNPNTPKGYNKEYAKNISEVNRLKKKFKEMIYQDRINKGYILSETKHAIKNSLPEVVNYFNLKYKLDL